MKLTLLFLTLSIPVCAQFHNVKGVRIVERTAAGDSTTISGVGQIQYDGDDDKLRFNDGTGWYSYIKEGATLPYWPLTGTKALTGNTSINGAFNLNLGTSGSKLNNFFVWSSDVVSLISDDGVGDLGNRSIIRLDDELLSFLRGSANSNVPEQRIQAQGDSLFILVTDGIETFTRLNISYDDGLVYEDSTTNSYGIRYSGAVTPTDSTLVTKAYVDNAVGTGAFMPLTGSADMTGDVTIDGNNHNLTFGSTNRLNNFTVRSDAAMELNHDAGSLQGFIQLSSGLFRVALSDDDGSTADVDIIVQTGSAPVLQLAKDGVMIIEIEADGDIIMPNLPTDCTGRDAGTLWNDSNTVKLCP